LCNLYSVTKGQQAIGDIVRAMNDRTGNLPPMPGIYPDYSAPIVRNTSKGRELTDKIDLCMDEPIGEALPLQRPSPDDVLKIVARGDKEDLGGLVF
jgi:hypothetical protein